MTFKVDNLLLVLKNFKLKIFWTMKKKFFITPNLLACLTDTPI